MKPKNTLIRVVRSPEGEIFVDETGKASGRGAYVCNNEECLKKIQAKKLLHKSFSTDVDKGVYDKIGEDVLGNE
jgi:predicted RNA-binding protein YlxR (DUF448 family)